jgi:hypothetical protein
MQNIDEKEPGREISLAGAGYLHFLPEQGDLTLNCLSMNFCELY